MGTSSEREAWRLCWTLRVKITSQGIIGKIFGWFALETMHLPVLIRMLHLARFRRHEGSIESSPHLGATIASIWPKPSERPMRGSMKPMLDALNDTHLKSAVASGTSNELIIWRDG